MNSSSGNSVIDGDIIISKYPDSTPNYSGNIGEPIHDMNGHVKIGDEVDEGDPRPTRITDENREEFLANLHADTISTSLALLYHRNPGMNLSAFDSSS